MVATLAGVAAIAVGSLGCGGSSDDDAAIDPAASEPAATSPALSEPDEATSSSASDPAATDAVTGDPAPTDPPATEIAPTDPPDTEPVPTPAPTTTEPVPPRELSDLGTLPAIEVTTPASGNGERPLLAWSPVDGAAGYALTLGPDDGPAYWAWSGDEAQVWLGGTETEPPAAADGPILTEPMLLRVVALDGAGSIVAASPPTPIAP